MKQQHWNWMRTFHQMRKGFFHTLPFVCFGKVSFSSYFHPFGSTPFGSIFLNRSHEAGTDSSAMSYITFNTCWVEFEYQTSWTEYVQHIAKGRSNAGELKKAFYARQISKLFILSKAQKPHRNQHQSHTLHRIESGRSLYIEELLNQKLFLILEI